tara:strand:+ start:2562 stop:3167 length:606 start_codon:yes stop_codon:yes gene_type:complete
MINIYDYETLSTDLDTAPVVSVAAMTLDEDRFLSDNPFSFLELVSMAKIMKFNVTEQVQKYGRVIDPNTLAWWKSLGPEAMKAIAPMKSDVSITELHGFLTSTLTPKELVFTRGNSFDPVLTTSICKLLGQPEPYKFWMVRDTRTFIEGIALGHAIDINNSFIPATITEGEFIAHNPAHDIAMDICRIQGVLRTVFKNETL